MIPYSTVLLNGKAIASTIQEKNYEDTKQFNIKFNRSPSLHVILVGDNPASHLYVNKKEKAAIKIGVTTQTYKFQNSISENEIIDFIHKLNNDSSVDGILVQLPLPNHISEYNVVNSINPNKDVDGLNYINAGLLSVGNPKLQPCTPLGCLRLIHEANIDIKGSNAVVVGASNLVGKPMSQILLSNYATVSITHIFTKNLSDICMTADILVVAVGKPNLIKENWIKPGAVVIDVGINRINGKIIGDVEFNIATCNAKAITPVPGGVGPLTVAYLMKNTILAANLLKNNFS